MKVLLAFSLALSLPLSGAHGQTSDSAHPPATARSAVTDADVVAAIERGRSTKKPFGHVIGGSGFMRGLCGGATRDEGPCAFEVVAQGPFGRIASAAAEATKKYMAFTAESVTADLRAPVLLVMATPRPPNRIGSMWSHAPQATHVVIQVRGEATIQPVRVETFPVTWGNAFGAQSEGQGVRAYFNTSDLPAQDFEIVVVTSGKESRFYVKESNREKLR